MLPLFILFGLLNALLFRWKGTASAISTLECYMATIGLGATALLLRFHGLDYILHYSKQNNNMTLQKTPFFTRSFLLLSLCEVLFTIVAPWVIIVFWSSPSRKQLSDRGGDSEEQQDETIYKAMIAHLFAFQAQIAWEACLMGRHADVELFLYTGVANAYRGWILLFQSWPLPLSDTSMIDVTIWRLTTALWCFSSFIFMPLIWYPCLEKVNVDGKATTAAAKLTAATKEHSS